MILQRIITIMIVHHNIRFLLSFSMSNLTVVRRTKVPTGCRIVYMQSAMFGYGSGYDGEVRDPFNAEKLPPHAVNAYYCWEF